MRRLLAVALLLLSACGKGDPSPSPTDGGTQVPDAGPGTPSIRGSLTVHTDAQAGEFRSVNVLLGDGSRFRKPLSGTDARFDDVSLTGPQDVSVVMVMPTGDVTVQTALGIDQPEVWISLKRRVETVDKVATITGRVTGASGTGFVDISAVGQGLSGSDSPDTDGTYSLEVSGPTLGPVTLVATERSFSPDALLRVGLKRNVSVSEGQTVSGQDVALAHAPDRSVIVTATGQAPYGSELSASVEYYDGANLLFNTRASGTSPLSVPAFTNNASFNNTGARLRVLAGDEQTDDAVASVSLPLGGASSSTVSLLAPMTLSAPALGNDGTGDPIITPRAGVVFRWSIDSAAQLGTVSFFSEAGSSSTEPRLDWIVAAPPSITSFKPFTLPSDVSPLSTFVPGTFEVDVISTHRGDVNGYAGYFTRDYKPTTLAEERTTEGGGRMRFQ